MNNALNHRWSRQNPGTLPPPRKASSMAYDEKHGMTILFGGGGLNDTWAWEGKTWTRLNGGGTEPPARLGACMVYDAARENIVLFGGVDKNGRPIDDTWTWNGTTWAQQHPHSSPAARCGASMVYDAARQWVVLFGGETNGGRTGALLNDTWTWDGSTWTRRQAVLTPPLARLGAGMAYDAGYQHTVLFGGTNGSSLFNDTWVWDGKVWTEQSPSARPPARTWASMAYDGALQQMVLMGGEGPGTGTGPVNLNDTWTWDGTTWSQHPISSAPSGGYQSAVYDSARQNVVVYATAGAKADIGNKKNGSVQASTELNWGSEIWLWTAQ